MPSAAGDEAREHADADACVMTAAQVAAVAGLVADRARPPEEAMAALLRLAAEFTETDAALLSRVEPARGRVTVLAVAGDAGIAAGDRMPYAESFGGAVVDDGVLLTLPDIDANPTWRNHRGRRHAPAVRAYYGAPVLRPNGQPFGALACVATEPRALGPGRCDLLEVLAAIAAPLALRLEAARGEPPPATAEPDIGRFRAMVEHASDLLAEMDPQGRIRYANPAFADFLGMGPDAAGGVSLLDLLHPEDASAWAAALARMGAEVGPLVPLAGRLRRADGSWRRVEGIADTLAGQPNVDAVVLAARDVTDRVAADAALAAERDRLRSILDAIPDPVFLRDIAGRVVQANAAAAEVWGMPTPEAAVGMHVEDHLPAESAVAAVAEDKEVFATGRPVAARLHALDRPDGRRWFLHDKTPIVGADGTVTGLVGVWRDVTDLHRATEEAASRAGVLARSKMLVDHTSDIILEVDPEGIIRSVNPAITRLLGIRPEDIVGTSGFDWIAPADLPAVREAFATIVATPGVSPPCVTRAFRADGSIAWLEETGDNQLHDPAVGSIVFVVHDVSAQHEAEARLRAERDLLQSVIDASSEVITVQDASGRYSLMNAAAAKAFRLPDVAAGIGKRPIDLLRPEEAEQQARVARRIMETGDATTDEIVFGDAIGGPAWYLVNRHPLRDAGGRVTGMVGVARDVTPLKLAEQEAATERDLLQAFIDVVPDMLFLKDVDGRFLRMNAAYAGWLGLPNPEAAIGMKSGDFMPPDEAAELAEQDRRIVATGETLRDHVARSEGSGGTRWFLRTTLPHRDAGGRVVGVVGAYRDVTGLVLAEQEMERERDLLQQILDALRDRIVVKDRDGGFVRVNRAAARSLGLDDPGEAIGRPALAFEPAVVAGDGAAGDAAALAGEVVEDLREERASDGQARWVLVGKTPLRGPDGGVVGLVVAVTDVSVVKEAEQRMAEALAREQAINAELERLDQARGVFIAMLSHEFRTPLTAIVGYGELLREYALDQATTREYADEIARSADRLSRLTGDVLDLERMRSDRFQIERAPIDLAALLRDVVSALRPSAPDHDLRLEAGPDVPLLAGDADRLIQVFTNLVSNAVKYSPNGGEVVVSARADGDGVLASVRDRGMGIARDDRERVFEPYVRLGDGVGRGISGTGLGLPIARQLVELHGGAIWVESEPGGGSTFFVRLPAGVSRETRDERRET